MQEFRFEELKVYQNALIFVDLLYISTKTWPKDEIFGLISQLRRAAVSIVLNIAEGSSRTRKDFCHFLDLSKGSCYECVAILTIALKRNYIDQKEFEQYYQQLISIAKMLSKLNSSLSNNH